MSIVNSTTDQHRPARIPVTAIKGIVSHDAISLPCLCEDISEEGFLLLWSGTAKVGNRINVKLKLSNGTIFCVAEVKWCSDEVMGCHIVEISKSDSMRLKVFIEDYYSKKAYREGVLIR